MTQPENSAVEAVAKEHRDTLTYYEQMLDAQTKCVPCKLCGGRAVISDAGRGAGYYIACENSRSIRDASGCLIDARRLGGWAYNVMEWCNRLHAIAAMPATPSDQEPVALWHRHPDETDELEFYRHGSGCLMPGDIEDGWTETPLYTRPATSDHASNEAAWRDGFQSARNCLTDDESFDLTVDVEQDAWLDSATRNRAGGPATSDQDKLVAELVGALGGLLRMTDFDQGEPWVVKANEALTRARQQTGEGV